jgi:hypothetical protein
LKNLNRPAFIWTIVWVNLIVLLIAQLVFRSIPNGDTLFMAVDVGAIVFVGIRLKRSLAILKAPTKTPN